MKQLVRIFAAVLIGGGCIHAEDKKPAPAKAPVQGPAPAEKIPPATKTLGFVMVGDMDAKQVEAFRKFAEFNLGVVVKQLPAQKPAGGSLDDEAKALKKLVTKEIAHVVALVDGNKDKQNHMKVYASDGVAVVNLAALKHEKAQTYTRRVDRCMMRGFGFLMGLDPSPNPHSALYPYKGTEQLDMIGRNYDPPYLRKYQQAAQKNGFKFLDYRAMRLVQ